MMKKLAAKGHEVTVLTTFPGTEKIPNFEEIFLPGLFAELERKNKPLLYQTN